VGVRGFGLCARAQSAHSTLGALGVLRFVRARMSENTAQGHHFFQTQIHTDLRRFELEREDNRELARRQLPKIDMGSRYN